MEVLEYDVLKKGPENYIEIEWANEFFMHFSPINEKSKSFGESATDCVHYRM